jgi:formamidopyrimidine-DNA glycosylase
MSGRLHLKDLDDQVEKHTHVSLGLDTTAGRKRLDFVDPRTFGEVRLAPAPDMASMGADLSVPVAYSNLNKRVAGSKKPVKAVLLEQGLLVSGVGNYLADEICHSAGIPPTATVSSLSRTDLQGLLDRIPSVFEDFALLRGTALADEGWRDLYGTLGDGSSILQVHGRTHCRSCASPVNRVKIAGRSAYICPTCQP